MREKMSAVVPEGPAKRLSRIRDSMESKLRLAELNERYAIAGVAEIVTGNGGLPKIHVETGAATADIYLHGAQVTSWKPAGSDEVLFVSEGSHWKSGLAIRGGIPVCFPWFRAKADDPQAPSHGFVRTKEWQIESILRGAQDSVCACFSIESDESTLRWWPFHFRVEYRITVGDNLRLELRVKNTGHSSFRFEEALHTYFRVGDVSRCRVGGLDGVRYLDNRDANRTKVQSGDLVLSGPTDDAFIDTTGSIQIEDPTMKRKLKTEKHNSASTIVWNPWSDGATSLADLGRDEWRNMLCAEGGNILSSAVLLGPGATHSLAITVSSVRE